MNDNRNNLKIRKPRPWKEVTTWFRVLRFLQWLLVYSGSVFNLACYIFKLVSFIFKLGCRILIYATGYARNLPQIWTQLTHYWPNTALPPLHDIPFVRKAAAWICLWISYLTMHLKFLGRSAWRPRGWTKNCYYKCSNVIIRLWTKGRFGLLGSYN